MKAALYCRLSEEDRDKQHPDDDSGSIRNQKAMLIQYARRRGWTIYDVYSDDDHTGTDRSRPQFNRLLDDAKNRRFDIVLCKTQSRFTRELELVETYIHDLFPRLGIRFVSIVDSADTEDPGNKRSRQINGLVNEWFLEDLSGNIRSVLTDRRRQGLHIGSRAPYGYRKDPCRKGHLLIDPEAAAVVREIFRLYAAGHGKTAIAKMLNGRGIPNPTEYKRRQGLVTTAGGTLWGYSTITDMLSNEVYIGNLVQGRSETVSCKSRSRRPIPRDQWIIVTDTHEPIIDSALWDQTQRRIAAASVCTSGGQEGVFSRKVRCAQCGYRLHTVKNGSKRGFSCRTHALSADACPGVWIALPKLERIVLSQIQALSREFLDMDALERGIRPHPALLEQRTQLIGQIARLRHKIEQNRAALRSAYLDRVNGSLSEADLIARSSELKEDSLQLERQISAHTDLITRIDRTLSADPDKKQLAARYALTESLTRDMAQSLIDHILVGRRDPATGITPVEIHWNF